MSLIPVPLPSPTLLLIRAAASASATVNGTAPRASSSAAPPSNVTHYSGPFGTEWSVKADSTRDMIGMSACAILAVTVTILQVMHCFMAAIRLEPGQMRRIFIMLMPGLTFLLAFYVMLSCYFTNFPTVNVTTKSPPTLSRIFYAFLYFTENFANILLAISTMALLHFAERDWYQNRVIIMWIRRAVGLMVIIGWLAMVVVYTTMYTPPQIVAKNALLTLLVYKPNLMISHAIVGCFNFVSLDIAISSLVLRLHVNKAKGYGDVSGDRRVNFLSVIAGLLLVRSLTAIVIHVLAIIPIQRAVIQPIYVVLLLGWLVLMPLLLYGAIYAYLRYSDVPAPLRFRVVLAAIGIVMVAILACLKGAADAIPETETTTKTETVWVPAYDPPRFGMD